MTFLLLVLTFLLFAMFDYYLRGKPREITREVVTRTPQPLPAMEPVWVAGYRLPEALYYHKGHTWVRTLGESYVLVGMDDFAGRLVGPARGLKLPAVGTWLRQGELGFEADLDGRTAGFVAPVEGEVVEVNEDVRAHPSLAVDDPFGRGWVMKVRARSLVASLRNLLSGSLARRWMEDAREGLDLRLMALSGSVIQDGGEPVANFARHLPPEEWKRLVGDFLLT